MNVPLIEQVKAQAQVLVPLVKALQTELGEEQANAIVRKTLGDTYRKYGEKRWRARATGDLGETMTVLGIGFTSSFTARRIVTTPVNLKPAKIKQIRLSAHVSQPVFARYLNTSESTIQKWESGSKQPSGMALKLLAVVKKHGLEVVA
jgi:DNA-binding transcriptional regulator YiaG